MREKSVSLVDLESVGFTVEDLQFEEFDSAEYLDTREAIAAFLTFAVDSGDIEQIKSALRTAARAVEMAKLASQTDFSWKDSCKALEQESKPKLQTVLDLLGALGVQLQIVPKEAASNKGRAPLD